ncbi:MAG: hypothetical protein RL042_386 [Nitrospirota bacterium]|jgi:hypothetical protein
MLELIQLACAWPCILSRQLRDETGRHCTEIDRISKPHCRPVRVRAAAYPLCTLRGLNEARTTLAGFFNTLLGWEERAPTEDSIGTAEISAGL